MNLTIKGHFVNSDNEFDGVVVVKDGVITNIFSPEDFTQEPDLEFDNSCLIFPGMGDIHVHAREDETGKQCYKEDYDTCQSAAIQGGVVHISAMPNTPNPLLTEEQLSWCSSLDVYVLNYAGIGPGTLPLTSSVPYKAYTGPSVGPLFFKNETELREVLQHYRGKPVSFHVEDYEVLKKHENETSHDKRRPVEAVEVALKYVLEMIEEFSLKAKLCHWSCGDISFDMIRRHRERGFRTTIEVSPLHLFYDTNYTETHPEKWPYLQMNPSLQSQAHRMQLIKEGFIDYIATDHAPHTLQEKFKNFQPENVEKMDMNEQAYKDLLASNFNDCKSKCLKNGTSGTPQLDTFALIAAWLIKEHQFTAQEIARVASKNPGTFVNEFLPEGTARFGEIKLGYSGSFTVINMAESTLVERKDLKTKVKWSPFEGITFPGKVEATIIHGKVF